MVKDPLDNGRTAEFEFPEVSFEKTPEVVPVEPVVEEPPEFTPMADDKLKAALAQIHGRSFADRNPHLGKMINCVFCGQRHRVIAFAIRESRTEDGRKIKTMMFFEPCKQTFTQVVKDGYEYFREDPKTGTLVPDLRTAVDPELEPTVNQQTGAPFPKNFSSPRKHPHPNTNRLQLVERTRVVFFDMGFTETKGEQAQKNMVIARKEAGHQLHREDREQAKKKRDQQKRSRKINRGR